MLPKQYNDYDMICLKQKDYEKISLWVKDNAKKENYAFPITKGIIKLEMDMTFSGHDIVSYNVFSFHNDKLYIDVYEKNYRIIQFVCSFNGNEFNFKVKYQQPYKTETGKQIIEANQENFMKIYAVQVFDVLYFMANFKEEKRMIYKEENNRSNALLSRSNKDNYIKLGRTVYNLRPKRSILEKTSKEMQRHTFSWSRRGHWRTYKDGKKIWIKETIVKLKEGDKEEIKPKKYKL